MKQQARAIFKLWDLWVPRSYTHAAAVRAAVNDQRYLNVVGVYREESGCGACTGTPMNSDAQEEWEAAEEYRVAFKSVAGSPWFMRSTTFSEPNGNYVKDCWLTTSWGWDEDIGFRLDDCRHPRHGGRRPDQDRPHRGLEPLGVRTHHSSLRAVSASHRRSSAPTQHSKAWPTRAAVIMS